MRTIKLYFVRHGQTEWNLQNRLQGAQNSALTVRGIEDAKLTGEYLNNIEFSCAYSSPQLRAVETRDYILSNITHADRIMTKIIPNLAEMDYGTWEGLYIDDLKKIQEFNTFLNDAVIFDGKLNQGENYRDVLERGVKAIDEIINYEQQDNNILIVSHGNFLRLLLCHLSGKDWQKHRDDNYFPKILNASISVFSCEINPFSNEKKFTFSLLNSIEHLSAVS